MKAIKTLYNKTLFRSKLEASYAKTFDSLGIKWSYEVNGYDLGKMRYLPDFWLPDIHTFIEVKGPVTPGAEKAEALAKAVEDDWFDSTTMVIIGNEFGELKIPGEDDDARLQKCAYCKKYCFVSMSRSYACRNCGAHDGDGHVEAWYDRIELKQIII